MFDMCPEKSPFHFITYILLNKCTFPQGEEESILFL